MLLKATVCCHSPSVAPHGRCQRTVTLSSCSESHSPSPYHPTARPTSTSFPGLSQQVRHLGRGFALSACLHMICLSPATHRAGCQQRGISVLSLPLKSCQGHPAPSSTVSPTGTTREGPQQGFGCGTQTARKPELLFPLGQMCTSREAADWRQGGEWWPGGWHQLHLLSGSHCTVGRGARTRVLLPEGWSHGVGSQQCPAQGAGLVVSAQSPFPASLLWEPC